LAAARTSRWHQESDALLTLEAAREWVSEVGLVLFAPRAQQLPTPAASLVEATLGRVTSAPTAAETETARGLVGRMVAEGAALPLNLLGSAGDVPDFVVSAQVFSYVFTLRGDKNWKQPPTTSGSMKVSLLAAKVYETLALGNALTARELASELGREVTEAAIVRALGELWAQLRVIPVLQQDGDGTKSSGAKGSGTMWELTSRRFTKQMKAGANAGQPTALSALISLYLAQAYAATEEEVETFLSPLAARSKVRDVLHGLRAARQLESVVLEGKTLVYVPGALPEFAEIAAAEPEKEEGAAQVPAAGGEATRERIRRFDGPRPAREERGERTFRGERKGPIRTDRARPSKPFGEKKDGVRREGKSFGERERRPFQRDRAQGERKSFTKPWDEERRPRERREGERPERERPRRDGETRPPREKREFRSGPRSSGPRKGGAERGERPQRPFRPRPDGERSPRPRREGERPFRSRTDGERVSRPRREGERPFRPRTDGERPIRPRRDGEGTSRPRREGERPFRSRPDGERPARPRREGERPFRARPEGERPARPKREGERPFRPRREGGESAGARAGKPSWPRREGAPGERSQRASGGKPGGKPYFGEKRKFGGTKFGDKKKFAGKPKFGGKPSAKGGPRKSKPKPKREAEE
jgi:hypothetical protein